MPDLEKKEFITDEEAVEILKSEGIASERFQSFLDQGEKEADLANTNLANLEWDFRLAIIYNKAGLNKEYELQDLEELYGVAVDSEEFVLAKRIDKMMKGIQTENTDCQ